MTRMLWAGLVAGAVIAVGVLVVYAEGEGIRTTGIIISGEGEGEGEPDADTLTFEHDAAATVFEGNGSIVDFKQNGGIMFEGQLGMLDFQHMSLVASLEGGVFNFGALTDAPGALAGGPADFVFGEDPPIDSEYVVMMTSAGISAIRGDTGLITAGNFSMAGEGEGEEFEGAYLWGQEPDGDTSVALIHAGPSGGLAPAAGEGEGEGEGESSPISEMVVLGPPTESNPGQQPENAYLKLQANATQGQVSLGNVAGSSITLNTSGSVVVRLGSVSALGSGYAGAGANTGNMMSSMDAMMNAEASAAEEGPPAGNMRSVPRIGIHSIAPPPIGS